MRVKVIAYEPTGLDDIEFTQQELVGAVVDFYAFDLEELAKAEDRDWTAGTVYLLDTDWKAVGVYIHRLKVVKLALDGLLGEGSV
jgi:hypothetical protein